MSSDTPAVCAEKLGKTFAIYDRPLDRLRQAFARGKRTYGKQFVALSDISFSLLKGSVLGLVGKNGAGKSTLLQLVCKTLQPTCGEISVCGRVAALLELGSGFNPEFSGRENIFLNASVLGLNYQEIEQRYDEIVRFSELAEFIDQPVKTYSSGMYVRLAFSIATSVNPDILIIDEALSVGDGAFARKSFDRIMALKDGGATILFCSHSMYHIEAICDQAMWLERGKMIMLDSPEKVARIYSESLLAQMPTPPNDLDGAEQVFGSTSPLPSGEGRLLKVTVSVDGVSGKKLKAKAKQSDLEIKVAFKISPELPPPSIAFALETIGGQVVTSTSTQFDRETPTVNLAGEGHITLRYPKIPLMRGVFRISVFLACEQVIHVYDHAAYCVELEVEGSGLEQGLVYLPHTWSNLSLASSHTP